MTGVADGRLATAQRGPSADAPPSPGGDGAPGHRSPTAPGAGILLGAQNRNAVHPGFLTDTGRPLFDPGLEAMPAAERRARQLAAIEREWERAWQLPFYQERYRKAGLTPGVFPGLDAIPLTRKSDLRLNEAVHPPFGTHRSVPLHDAVRISRSTGTTGKPWYTFYTIDDIERMREIDHTIHWRAGYRPGMHYSLSFPQNLYPTNVNGGRSMRDAGMLEIPVGVPFSLDDAINHIHVWQELGVDILMLSLPQFNLYDEAAKSIGIELPELLDGRIVAMIELSMQWEAPRRRMENAFNVRIRNTYGVSDCIGFSCLDGDAHSGMAQPIDYYVIQICDPETGREVAPGTPGHLVVTMFGMDQFMMRFDSEDLVVERTDPCPTGSTLMRWDYLGRIPDMAVIGASRILPVHVQLELEAFGAPEFGIGAGTVDTLRVKVEHPDADLIARHLSDRLGVPATVESLPSGSLPRSAYKPRRLAAD